MTTQFISAEAQISYRILMAQAVAAAHPYPGQLDQIREQLLGLSLAWGLYKSGRLEPLEVEDDRQGLQQGD